MRVPSVKDRAKLLASLRNVNIKIRSYQLIQNKALLQAYNDIVDVAEFLQISIKVAKFDVTHAELETTSIISLCKTLHALKIQDVNKPRVCQMLRQYLQSEEPCMCAEDASAHEAIELAGAQKKNIPVSLRI